MVEIKNSTGQFVADVISLNLSLAIVAVCVIYGLDKGKAAWL